DREDRQNPEQKDAADRPSLVVRNILATPWRAAECGLWLTIERLLPVRIRLRLPITRRRLRRLPIPWRGLLRVTVGVGSLLRILWLRRLALRIGHGVLLPLFGSVRCARNPIEANTPPTTRPALALRTPVCAVAWDPVATPWRP